MKKVLLLVSVICVTLCSKIVGLAVSIENKGNSPCTVWENYDGIASRKPQHIGPNSGPLKIGFRDARDGHKLIGINVRVEGGPVLTVPLYTSYVFACLHKESAPQIISLGRPVSITD